MQMSFTDMLSLDCTNKGRVAKGGNIHLSKVRSWQANVIAFDDTALNEWLMQASPTALTKAAVIAYAEGCFW
jgi:hypothetical protein